MTELERTLLNALEQLQSNHEKQHSEFVTLYNDLVKQFKQSQQDNESLRKSVSNLTLQVRELSREIKK